jgi:hypothetical protein
VRHAEIRRLAIALREAAARSRPTVPSREAIVDELAVDLTSIALLRGSGHHPVLDFRCHSGAVRTGPGVRQSTRGDTWVAL